MTLTLTVAAIGLVFGLAAGYLLGWRAGALDSARWATMFFEHGEESLDNDVRRQWMKDLLEKARREPHISVRERMAGDEVFQRQLLEQQDGNGHK